ncbi:DnaD domain protein [Alkalibacterium thalassium]|uniref:DnaD and phage-associated domain-containing protein n=1 Tax=Alkalibacterium thalassium TaxID=426701 RepID=A0A1G8VRM6_9LACT|nr:DnaD domain protein [Alkalibacterium thalassium]SDJ68731.1 DnaD and phage-associated domain-containing protein [Alkalibacterium thalassium]
MGRIKRIVNVDFWQDDKVIDTYSVEDKYFLLYLMTNPKSKQLGIYKLPKKIMAFEMGYSLDTVKVLLDRFETKYQNIIYNHSTQEIAVLNSLKYSIVKGGKPVEDLLKREIGEVEDVELIELTYQHLTDHWLLSSRAFDKTIKELFEEELRKRKEPKEKEFNNNKNDNDNDNDNEESYPDSYHESYNESSNEKKQQVVALASWEKLWLFPNEFQREELMMLVDNHGDELVSAAIKLAGSKDVIKGRALPFLNAVIKEWSDNNVTTVEQAREYQKNRNKQFKKNDWSNKNNSNARQESLPSWAVDDYEEPEDEMIDDTEFKKRLERIRARKGAEK